MLKEMLVAQKDLSRFVVLNYFALDVDLTSGFNRALHQK